MAETEAPQTWVSTGRGGAGNFPYTPRALAKRPVTLSAPQGREVDFRKQGIARSGRGGVGHWKPSLDENAKAQQAEQFERDQEVIKERAFKQQSINTDESFVIKSGRGGVGNITSPVEQSPPTTNVQEDGAPLERVHSYGRGGGNFRYGDAIPLVEMNRIETQERVEVKSKPPSITTPTAESGFATFANYASAFLNSLTPAENRMENMTPSPTSPTYTSRRVSMGGRGGAGNIGYTVYKPASARTASNNVPPTPSTSAPASPSQAHLRPENQYAAYSSASYAAAQRGFEPERPQAGPSSSSHASTSGSSSSSWA